MQCGGGAHGRLWQDGARGQARGEAAAHDRLWQDDAEQASRGGGVAAAQNVEGALFTKQIVIVSVNLGLDFLFSLIFT